MTRSKSTPGSKPAGSGGRRMDAAAAARIRADELRQAECAAMLIAVTRMLLNLRGRDYAAWLRSIADDFEATDLETEDPDELGLELARKSGGGRQGEPEDEPDDGDRAILDDVTDEPPPGPPRRAH